MFVRKGMVKGKLWDNSGFVIVLVGGLDIEVDFWVFIFGVVFDWFLLLKFLLFYFVLYLGWFYVVLIDVFISLLMNIEVFYFRCVENWCYVIDDNIILMWNGIY